MLNKNISVVIDKIKGLSTRFGKWIRDITRPRHTKHLCVVADLFRSKTELAAENALLRQQLIVLNRQVKKPRFTPLDRTILVFLSRLNRSWCDAILIAKPQTILRWHRWGYKLFWRFKTKSKGRKPKISAETISLIRQMARENRLWGAERIRGELLKLGIRVSKRTIQRYIATIRKGRPTGQKWTTFIRNHTHQTWACDFLQTYDIFFRTIFAFFIIDLGTRRVIRFAVTRSPSRQWVAQQLREATPFAEGPRFLIRDNDDKFGPEFDNVAKACGTKVLRTPVRAPRANSFCERFVGSARRECLDHVIILSVLQMYRCLSECCRYFNESRRHQGIEQRVPLGTRFSPEVDGERVVSIPILGGLHHEYRRVA